MPSSRIIGIPWVLSTVIDAEPKSILDVGIGWGKYGMLLREYLEICPSGKDTTSNCFYRSNWKITIDGIEIYPDYVTKLQKMIYNHVWLGDASKILPDLSDYDVILLADVIEHMPLKVADEFLKTCVRKARKIVLVLTPLNNQNQGPSFGNEHERHLSLWEDRELERFNARIIRIAPDYTMATIKGNTG